MVGWGGVEESGRVTSAAQGPDPGANRHVPSRLERTKRPNRVYRDPSVPDARVPSQDEVLGIGVYIEECSPNVPDGDRRGPTLY